MTNQEFKAQGRNYQVLPNLGSVVWRKGGLNLPLFTHVHAVTLDYSQDKVLMKVTVKY